MKIYNDTLSDLIKNKIISSESMQAKANIEEVEGLPYADDTENGTVVRIVRVRYARSETGTDFWTAKEGRFRVYNRQQTQQAQQLQQTERGEQEKLFK